VVVVVVVILVVAVAVAVAVAAAAAAAVVVVVVVVVPLLPLRAPPCVGRGRRICSMVSGYLFCYARCRPYFRVQVFPKRAQMPQMMSMMMLI